MTNKINVLNLFLSGILIGTVICNIRDYGYSNLYVLFIFVALVFAGTSVESLTKRQREHMKYKE